MEAGCKRVVVVAREQLSFFTLKKLCLAHSLLIVKIWKKAELLAWKEKNRLSSKPRGLDLNVFSFLFVLILSMHVYAILFFLFVLLGKNLPIHCLVSPTTLSQLTSKSCISTDKLLYFKKNKVSLPSLDSKKYFWKFESGRCRLRSSAL